MMSKLKSKKGEIGTIVMMALLVIVSFIGFSSQKFLSSKKTISTQAAEITRYGSMNCTPEQICGNYANYVAGSQYQQGSVRVVKCKDGSIPASPSSCIVSLTGVPPTITPNANPPACVSGAYTELAGCENICGIGLCRSCKLGSVTKYECIVGDSVPQCTASMTYATIINCQSASCSDCRQCHLAGDTAVRYQCGIAGPTMGPNATPTSPPAPTKTPTPIASKTPTPTPTPICLSKSYNCPDSGNTFSYWLEDRANCPGPGLNIACYGIASNNCNSSTWNQIISNKCYNIPLPSVTPTVTPIATGPTITTAPGTTPGITPGVTNPAATAVPVPPAAIPTLVISKDCQTGDCTSPNVGVKFYYKCENPIIINGEEKCGGSWKYFGLKRACEDGDWEFVYSRDEICNNLARPASFTVTFRLSNLDYEPSKPMAHLSIYDNRQTETDGTNPSLFGKSINLSTEGASSFTLTSSSASQNLMCTFTYNPRGIFSQRSLPCSISLSDGKGEIIISSK